MRNPWVYIWEKVEKNYVVEKETKTILKKYIYTLN